jgi:putative flippase GtrA
MIAGEDSQTTARRWLKFNFVGLIGIGVQLLALFLLKSALHMNYLFATALAIEAAVVHNFLWHERFTWADRAAKTRFAQFIKFNLTNGAISIFGSVLLMTFFAGNLRIPYLAANLMTIGCCSVFNFLASDRLVFRLVRRPTRECQHQSTCPAIWRSTDQMSSGFCSKG